MDWNASAPLLPIAKEAMLAVLEEGGNSSSIHYAGRRAKEHLDKARARIAEAVHARPENVIFTSGGSEANNLALANRGLQPLFVSAIEHESILRPAQRLGARLLPVDRNGIVDLEKMAQALSEAAEPAFLSVMLANNETGVIQPIRDIAALVHKQGGLLHCDASQALTRIDVDIQELGADMMTLSAHKAGGPLGTGALILRSDRLIAPMIMGGGQERGRRAGTENVPAIAGFGAIADRLEFTEVATKRNRLEQQLLEMEEEVLIFGRSARRLPNTISIASGKKAETLVIALDLAGIAISAGSACSSGKMQPSHVISAMGFDPNVAASAVRISLGPDTRDEEIEKFIQVWKKVHGYESARPAVAANDRSW